MFYSIIFSHPSSLGVKYNFVEDMMEHLELEGVEKGVRDNLVALQNVNSGNLSAFCVENPFTSGLIGKWAEKLESELQYSDPKKIYSVRNWWIELCECLDSETHSKSMLRSALCSVFSVLSGFFVGVLLGHFIFSWSAAGVAILVMLSVIGSVVGSFSTLAMLDLRAKERTVQTFRATKRLEFEQKVARLGSDPVFFIGEVTGRLRKLHREYVNHYDVCTNVFVSAVRKREVHLQNLQNSLRDLEGYSDDELPSRKQLISSIHDKTAEHEASEVEAKTMEAQVEARLGQIHAQLHLFWERISAFEVLKSRFETQEVLLARIRGYVGISEQDWEKSEQEQHRAQLQLVFASLDALGQDVTATQSALEAVTLMIPERSAYPSELTR